MTISPPSNVRGSRRRLPATNAIWIVPAAAPELTRWLLFRCPCCRFNQVNEPESITEHIRERRCVFDVVKRADGQREATGVNSVPVVKETAVVRCEKCRREARAHVVGRRLQPEPVTRDPAQLAEAYRRTGAPGDAATNGGQP